MLIHHNITTAELDCNRFGGRDPTLLIFGGLPTVRKTAIATGLPRHIGAVHLHIESIAKALQNSNVEMSMQEGYEVAYTTAENNLRLSRTVKSDSVSPVNLLPVHREAIG